MGGSPSRGGSIYQGGGAKNWKKGFFRGAKGAVKFLSTFSEILKIFSTFFEIFGKFVNKNAIKRDLGDVVGRYISKISKKSPFFGKKYIYLILKISFNENHMEG